ncbi:hypothetical protein BpHYR1_054075 [Brachionus plicatilis]|uniref:Uncharacterized protein n=1 Tax=Brachionus plicatilis TaxID=10195 RepID=A0A3M7Q571_BRAPC|nr:hypothetical protein BpHYR1_054075 [Brachionus plicatilis]
MRKKEINFVESLLVNRLFVVSRAEQSVECVCVEGPVDVDGVGGLGTVGTWDCVHDHRGHHHLLRFLNKNKNNNTD